jgi:energy-coupling factor transporter ATP-binding protein EcfA2
MIQDLKIEGFRGLNSLGFAELAQINLIVGKNNSGKTTVLEALRLLMGSDPREGIYSILSSRGEISFRRLVREGFSTENGTPLASEALFFGRPDLNDSAPHFSIRANGGRRFLEVEFVWIRRSEDPEQASLRYVETEVDEFESDAIPGFRITNDERKILFPIDRMDRINRMAIRRLAQERRNQNVVYLPSNGMNHDEIGRIWDSIALTDDEDEVINAIKIIAPTIEKLVMVQSPNSRSERVLMAKLKEFRSPVPFSSLGEGTTHLLSVILAIMQASGGMVLIDEVENGVHYSIHNEFWTLIAKLSEKLRVQVFATTHSWDCISGFEQALNSNSCRGVEGALFRVSVGDVGTEVTRFNLSELEIADDEGIEIR